MSPRARGWAWLALVMLLAGTRWGLMSSAGLYRPWLPVHWFEGANFGLLRLALNAATSAVLLGVVPVLVALWSRKRVGWENTGLGRPRPMPWRWFAPAVVVLSAAGFFAGRLDVVRNAYPVWPEAGPAFLNLLLSAGLVFTIVVSTEVLYRGPALQAMARAFGTPAIFMILPVYVLDHVGAPGLEVAGSALVGAALGGVAVGVRSIWPGAVLHAVFAVSVDLGALASTGRLVLECEPGLEWAH